MDGTENNLVNISEYLSEELPVPNEIVLNTNDIIDNEKLFKYSKNVDTQQPKINKYFKDLKGEDIDLE